MGGGGDGLLGGGRRVTGQCKGRLVVELFIGCAYCCCWGNIGVGRGACIRGW